jgi:hypothetical protein
MKTQRGSVQEKLEAIGPVLTRLALVFVLLSLVLPVDAVAQGRGLFVAVERKMIRELRAAEPKPPETTVRRRYVRVDMEFFKTRILAAQKQVGARPTIILQLFDDVRVELEAGEVLVEESGIYTWTSKVKADKEGKFGQSSLSFGGGVAVGLIHVGDKIYEIQPVREGVVSISEINQALFPPEAGLVLAPIAAIPTRIKVLVVLPTPTYRFLCMWKFPINILQLLSKNYEANLNGVFNAIKPTGVQTSVVTVCYNHTPEGGSLSADLSWLRTDAGIAALRDTHKADLVSFIVPESSFCGRGYFNFPVTAASAAYAFSVVKASCALSNYSLAHELGHNMGMRHDRVAAGAASSSDCDYGYIFSRPRGRSVLAYGSSCSGCTRYGLYSTPLTLKFFFITLGPFGVSCSTPAVGGKYTRANNRQQLIDAAPIVSAFR